jgi:adenylate cyclase class IV
MEKYCEITSKSLIDFEEIKFILANNNIDLVSSNQIQEKIFLKNDVSFANANYQTIMDNSLKLSKINDKRYLSYTSGNDIEKKTTRIEINEEDACERFLNHIGYKEVCLLELDMYVYSDGKYELNIINLINIGLYLNVKKSDSNVDELKGILNSFNIPYDEDVCNQSIEKLFINKLRRQMR